jgi:hypothetical protein
VLASVVALIGFGSDAAMAASVLAITTASLNGGEVGLAYATTSLVATGGSPPYTWSANGSLPAGLALSTRGVLSGVPQVGGTTVVTFTATDAESNSTEVSLSLRVAAAPTIATVALPAPVVGTPYSFQFVVAGGTPPYSWSVTAGPLPLGLVLNSSGLLSGLPSAAATTTTTIAVTDALGVRTAAPVVVSVVVPATPPEVYFVTSTSGGVSAYASPGVSVPQTAADGPETVVAIATDSIGDRYWLATASGAVDASPGGHSFGSVGKRHLIGTIVGIAAKPDGTGYWLASSTGHVYGFGSARSLGSVGKHHLRGTIVGIAANPEGTGYWLASSTGRVYGFGSAHSLREQRHVRINPTIVGIAADPSANGYWLVTRAGRVYAFGGAGPNGKVRHRHRLARRW